MSHWHANPYKNYRWIVADPELRFVVPVWPFL